MSDLAEALLSSTLANVLPRRPAILIAAMPKSASSYLTALVAALPGMRKRALSVSRGHREQEIDPIRAARNRISGYVAQQHVRYSEVTADILNKYGITPIVLVRDLPDVVVSLRDHVRREDYRIPMAWLTPAHLELPDEALDRLIVDLVMPWYINFFVGWSASGAPMLLYTEVVNNPEQAMRVISHHTGIRVSDAEITAAIDAAGRQRPRFNVGRVGRGTMLAPETRYRLRELCAYYPSVDFTAVGCGRADELGHPISR